jgi:hypothetical protein
MQTRRYLKIFRQAIFLTVFSSASFHLCIIALTAARGHYENANPVVFLGLDLMYPHLAHSAAWYIGSWAFLLACLAGFFFIAAQAHKRLARQKRQSHPAGLFAIALLQLVEDTEQFAANGRYTPAPHVAIYE